MPTPSTFAQRLAAVAEQQHTTYRKLPETSPQLSAQIKKYWQDLGFEFPGVDEAWSAVFVSWCVLSAGATSQEFRFDPQHSVFVHWAIQNASNHTGLFRANELTTYAPQIGDIIQNNRAGLTHDYNFARAHANYPSHSAIVTEVGHDGDGQYLMTVGGNENDAIRMTRHALTSEGLLIQRTKGRFICIIQDLK